MIALLLLLHPLGFVSAFYISSQSISTLLFLPKPVAPRLNGLHRPSVPRISLGPASRPRVSSGGYDRQLPGGFIPTRFIHTLHSSYLPLVIPPINTSNLIGTVHVVPNLYYLEFHHEFHHRHVLRDSGETRYNPTSSLTIGRGSYFSKPGSLALCSQLSQHSREDGPHRSIHR